MGEVTVSGAGALEFLNRTLTNDIRKLAPGQGQYTLMCNEHGGVIDDLYAYRLAPDAFFLIINASRIEADVAWLQAQAAKFSGGAVEPHRRLASLRRRGRARPAGARRSSTLASPARPSAVMPRGRRQRFEEKPDRRVSI